MGLASGWKETSTTERVALWIAGIFSGLALIGFATFGSNPQLLDRVPWAIPFYARSFQIFSIGQILVSAGALFFLLTRRTSFRWLLSFVALYVISLGSELSGTAVGFPFGPYYYTPVLGAKWFGLVPLVIPVSWFMMAIPSYALAIALLPEGGARGRILLGTLLLSMWDLALDPAMSFATFYWRWEVEGAYYGMPWVNLAGWLFTSVLLMGALHLLRATEWIARLPIGWLAGLYLINLILPLGMSAAAGLLWAVVATLGAYALLAGWLLFRRSEPRGARELEGAA